MTISTPITLMLLRELESLEPPSRQRLVQEDGSWPLSFARARRLRGSST